MTQLSSMNEGYYVVYKRNRRIIPDAFATISQAFRAIRKYGFGCGSDESFLTFGTVEIRTVYTDTH